MTHEAAEIAKLAVSMPAGSVRAVLQMTQEWQFPGRESFDANGAWNAWRKVQWAIDSANLPHGKHKRRAYKLNRFGVDLQNALRARAILSEKGEQK